MMVDLQQCSILIACSKLIQTGPLHGHGHACLPQLQVIHPRLQGWLKRRSEGCSLPSSAVTMERKFSDSSLALVAELVRWHLPARSLVRFKLVSKEWQTWWLDNLPELAKVRRKATASQDWYFPISFNRENRAWSAIHHASDKEHAEEEHRLPALDFLHLTTDDRIEDASGGLLLFKNQRLFSFGPSFYVVNPLTRKWRYLFCQNCCRYIIRNSYLHVLHAHIVVDEALREYTVLALTKKCLNIYSSHFGQWVCYPIHYLASPRGSYGQVFAVEPGDISRWRFPASACANGHVFICSQFEAKSDPETPRYREVIKVQTIPILGWAGRRPVLTVMAVDDFSAMDCFLGLGEASASPKLVECRGDIYIVASQCNADCSSLDVFVMRREFHIFKFQEGSTVCPLHVRHGSERTLIGRPLLSRLWKRREHFSCTARSGVIWLAWENHLLQYDVISDVWKYSCHSSDSFVGKSHGESNWDEDGASCLAYTPSFDLSP